MARTVAERARERAAAAGRTSHRAMNALAEVAAPAVAGVPRGRYELRQAKGKRVTCRTCRRPIHDAQVCLTQKGEGQHTVNWRHVECVKAKPAEFDVPVQDVPGFMALDARAQARVRGWLCGDSVFTDEDPTPAEEEGPPVPVPLTLLAPEGECGDIVPRKRKRAVNRHVEKGFHFKPWPAFSVENARAQKVHVTVRIEHAKTLLTRLQHEIHAQRPAEGMRLLALLLRDFTHLRTPLAQAGFELLAARRGELPRLQRYGKRMSQLDSTHHSTWLRSTAEACVLDARVKAADAAADEGVRKKAFAHGYQDAIMLLRLTLKDCTAEVACKHDGDEHGLLGLLYHAQLHLASSCGGKASGSKPPSREVAARFALPYAINPEAWRRVPPSLLGAREQKQQRKWIRTLRREQQWETIALPRPVDPPVAVRQRQGMVTDKVDEADDGEGSVIRVGPIAPPSGRAVVIAGSEGANNLFTLAQSSEERAAVEGGLVEAARLGELQGWDGGDATAVADRKASAQRPSKPSKPVRGRKVGDAEWTRYAGASEAARMLGLDKRNVDACCKKRSTHTGGYEFEYDTPDDVQVPPLAPASGRAHGDDNADGVGGTEVQNAGGAKRRDTKRVFRAFSSFMRHCNKHDPECSKASSQANRQVIGTKWKALSTEEKAPFEQQARADKARYENELEQARATLDQSEFEQVCAAADLLRGAGGTGGTAAGAGSDGVQQADAPVVAEDDDDFAEHGLHNPMACTLVEGCVLGVQHPGLCMPAFFPTGRRNRRAAHDGDGGADAMQADGGDGMEEEEEVQDVGEDGDDSADDEVAIAAADAAADAAVEDEGQAFASALGITTIAGGMRLHLSGPSNATGYLGVCERRIGSFEAQIFRDGKNTHIGTFGTAVEAAVAYAKHVQSLEADSSSAIVAMASGLRLHLSRKTTTGYFGVRERSSGGFKATFTGNGKTKNLGTFDTAVQAAIAYARHAKSLRESAMASVPRPKAAAAAHADTGGAGEAADVVEEEEEAQDVDGAVVTEDEEDGNVRAVAEDEDEEGEDSLDALREPTAALEAAQIAHRHLLRGLEHRPESGLYRLCAAQLLVLIGALVEITSSAGGVPGLATAAFAIGGASGESSSDNESGMQSMGRAEGRGEMYVRAAEKMVHEAAHEFVTVDGVHVPPSAAAKEAWLMWVRAYAPSNVHVLADATIGLLQADGASEMGFSELIRLLNTLHGTPDALVLVAPPPGGSSAPMASNVWSEGSDEALWKEVEAARDKLHDAMEGALESLPLGVALDLVTRRLELRPRDLTGWGALKCVLQWIAQLATRDDAMGGDEGTHAPPTPAVLATQRWWCDAGSWWPEACFEVELTPSVATGSEAGLWLLRQACAQRLLLVCMSAGTGQPHQPREVRAALAAGFTALRQLEGMRHEVVAQSTADHEHDLEASFGEDEDDQFEYVTIPKRKPRGEKSRARRVAQEAARAARTT